MSAKVDVDRHGVLAAALIASAFLAARPLPAASLFVDQSIGSDTNDGLGWAAARATVGSAIATAGMTPEADDISVAAGRYVEQLVVPAGVALYGGFPPGGGVRDPRLNRTLLDRAGERPPVVSFPPGSDGTVLDGFVVRGAWTKYSGIGAITVRDAGPLIRGNVVEDNNGCSDAAIDVFYTRPAAIAHVEDNVVRNNTCDCDTLGVHICGGIAYRAPDGVDVGTVVAGNVIVGNESELGAGLGFFGQGRIEDNVVDAHRVGSGVWLGGTVDASNLAVTRGSFIAITLGCGGTYRLDNVTLADNRIGIVAHDRVGDPPGGGSELLDSIVWGNGPPIVEYACANSDMTVVSSIVEGGYPDGVNVLDADPLFVPGPAGDYYLSQSRTGQAADSPALDAGSRLSVDAGLDDRTTATDSAADVDVVDLGYHAEPVLALTIQRGTAPDGLTTHATVMALPFVDAPGSLSDPLRPLLFYGIPEADNEIGIEKAVATDAARVVFLPGR